MSTNVNAEPIRTATATDPGVQAVADLPGLAASWAASSHAGADVLWRFAQQLAAFIAAGKAGASQKDIGIALAASVGRPTPYNVSWVSRAAKAAREWPHPPADPIEGRRFTSAFYGHERRDEKSNRAPMTGEQALAMAVGFAKKAIASGMDRETVGAAILDRLGIGMEAASI